MDAELSWGEEERKRNSNNRLYKYGGREEE